jgi:hypothetical protein
MRRFLLAVHHQRGNWRRAARQLAFDVEKFVCTPLATESPLAWDFLSQDRQRQRLHREHERALSLTSVPAS